MSHAARLARTLRIRLAGVIPETAARRKETVHERSHRPDDLATRTGGHTRSQIHITHPSLKKQSRGEQLRRDASNGGAGRSENDPSADSP